MRLKRLCVLAGVLALFGALWASPAAADGHVPTLAMDPASVPAEEGDVTVTVSGSNWSEPTPFFITSCTGAGGDPEAPLTLSSAAEAITMCPDLMASAIAVEWDDGSFTTQWTVTVTQADIDAGAVVVLAGWLSTDTLLDPDEFATVAVLNVGDSADDMDEGADDMDEGSDDMDEGADDMDEGADDMDGDSDDMDDGADDMDDGAEELPVTGSESTLLLVTAAGILFAGLLAIGAGRRVRAEVR